jgi:hypothetical protein
MIALKWIMRNSISCSVRYDWWIRDGEMWGVCGTWGGGDDGTQRLVKESHGGWAILERVHLKYKAVMKSFRTGRLERELQMVQLSATIFSCIAILWVSLVSFAAITPCVASQRMFIVVVRYRLSPETFGYTLVAGESMHLFWIHVAQ